MMMKRTRTRLTTTRPNKQPSFSLDPLEFRKKNVNMRVSYEKSMNQAEEALTIGDRIIAEGFYQKADHFLRLMNETKQHRPIISSSEKTNPCPDEPPIDDNDFESSIREELEIAQFGGNPESSSNQGAIAIA